MTAVRIRSNAAMRPLFRLGIPAAAESLVQIHQHLVLLHNRIAQLHLGTEIGSLGIEHVYVSDGSVYVLNVGEGNVLFGSLLKIEFEACVFDGGIVADHGIVNHLECLEHILFITQTGLIVSCDRSLEIRLAFAEFEHGSYDVAEKIIVWSLDDVLKGICLGASVE